MKEIKVQWHSGFVAAIDLELSANRGDLIYEKEYNLNTKPLEIDLLVIKKESHVRIANEIGRLFRGHNILEYKSPEDITVSIVREGYPEGLFEYFREHGIRTENPYRGIYYVLDGVLFPTQIIVTGELEGSNHTWLKSLSGRLKKEEMRNLLEEIDALTEEFERRLADAVLEVSVRANQEIVGELKGEKRMCQALLEIMEPEINKIVEEATRKMARETEEAARKAEEAAREAEEVAIRMVKAGRLSAEEIREFFPKLSAEQIKQIGKRLASD